MKQTTLTPIQELENRVKNFPNETCLKQKLLLKYVKYHIEKENLIFDVVEYQATLSWIYNNQKLNGNNLIFNEWQRFAFGTSFFLKDKTGKNFFNESFLEIGRGNGKSPFLSAVFNWAMNKAVARYHKHGENEFGFYLFAPNITLTMPAYENIKRITMGQDNTPFRVASAKGEGSFKLPNDWPIKFESKSLAYTAENVNGSNGDVFLVDEVHEIKDIEIYTNLVKSKKTRTYMRPLIFSISSGGKVDNGLYDYLYEMSENCLNNFDFNKRFLPIIFESDVPEKRFTIEEAKKANPSWNESYFEGTKEDIEKSIERKNNLTSEERVAYFRYNLNVKIKDDENFFDYSDFEYNHWVDENKLKELAKENSFFVGLDFSTKKDFSAITFMCRTKENKVYLFGKSFACSEQMKFHNQTKYYNYENALERNEIIVNKGKEIDQVYMWNWLEETIINNNMQINYVGYDRAGVGKFEEWFMEKANWYPKTFTVAMSNKPDLIQNAMLKLRTEIRNKKVLFNSQFLKQQFLNLETFTSTQQGKEYIRPDNKNKKKVHDEAVTVIYCYVTEFLYRKTILKEL